MGPEFCHVKRVHLPSICNSNFQRASLNLTLTEAPRLGFGQLGHLHPSCLGCLEGKPAITRKPYISWHKYWFAQTFFHENSWNQTNESCGQWGIPMFTSGAEVQREHTSEPRNSCRWAHPWPRLVPNSKDLVLWLVFVHCNTAGK